MTRIPYAQLMGDVSDNDLVLPARRKFKPREEDSLQVQIIRHLRRLGPSVRFLVSQGERAAANSTPQRRDRLKALGVLGNAGATELTILDARHAGAPRIWLIELKATHGKVSQEQLSWADWLQTNGYRYGLVRSVDELIALIG